MLMFCEKCALHNKFAYYAGDAFAILLYMLIIMLAYIIDLIPETDVSSHYLPVNSTIPTQGSVLHLEQKSVHTIWYNNYDSHVKTANCTEPLDDESTTESITVTQTLIKHMKIIL